MFSGLRKCLFKEFHKKGLLTDFGFDLKLEVTLRVNLNLIYLLVYEEVLMGVREQATCAIRP